MAIIHDNHTWFVEPKNPYTNQVLASFLPAEYFCPDKEVSSGEKLPLWEMERWAQVAYLMDDCDTRFNLWIRKGRHGKIQQVNFMIKKNYKFKTKKILENMVKNLLIKKPLCQPAT